MKDAHRSPTTKIAGARLLVVVAPYYKDVANMLLEGAQVAAREAEATLEIVTVPGAFEIPGAIALAIRTGAYDGFIALGCVVRGETSHYDYVCGESARGLMELSIRKRASIGYGILTVNTLAQAEERADPRRGDKGGESVRACAAMIALKRKFGEMMQ
ncbi:6,7-dimethyl-8-ribityllumazine synthase [Terricaulis sp.]|uniref:6,7-dimethyl-8-ribityllumazine synthase n=1 Tax=Terricaulis sp. TaxID=2768686 RepID=UPI00378433AA